MPRTVRVSTPCVVVHPVTNSPFTLKPDAAYDDTDPLVRAFPWAFNADNAVEQTTAAPGEKRNR